MAVVAAVITVIAAIISSGSSQDLPALQFRLYTWQDTSSVLKAVWSNHSAGKEMGGTCLT